MMAGNLRLYDPSNWAPKPKDDIALGLTNNVKGITFDGQFFWVVDQGGILYKGSLDQAMTSFLIDAQYSVGSQLTNFTRLTGITTDGLNLYLAWYAYAGIATARVTKFDKYGIALKQLTAFNANTITWIDNEYLDLTYNGLYVISMHGIGNPGGVMTGVDPQNDKVAWQTTFGTVATAAKRALTFNGLSFYCVRNGVNRALASIDYDQTVLSSGVNVGALDVQGACFGSKNYCGWNSGQNINEIDGEWLALVYN